MATIPKDIQENIKALSEKTETPVKSLLERLKEILETDEQIQSMEKEDFKIRFAWSRLYREHSMTGKTTDIYLTPIHQPRAREVKIKGENTFVGDLSAIVQLTEKDEEGNIKKGDIIYASGTFWRDAAKNLNKLEQGKVYKASVVTKDNNWGLEISSDRTGFMEVKEKLPEFKKFYEDEIVDKNIKISIGEMDLNKKENTTDIRIIEATVVEADVGESSSGNEYGRYVVMDDSIMGSNFAIFVDPKEVVWSQGSILLFGGTIDINDDGTVRWNNHFILPTDMSMPKTIQVKPVSGEKETIDINAEELEEDTTEETKEKETPKEPEDKKEDKKEESSEDIDFEI